jgi:Flp pilus assembly protein TadD
MLRALRRLFSGDRRARAALAADEPPAARERRREAARAAEACCAEASRHLAAGHLAEAEAALARALEHRHDCAEALVLQGVLYKKQGRLEDAADSFVLAEHFAPQLAETQFQLGLLAHGAGRRSEARSRFARALERDPRHARAHNALGALLVEEGALEEAEAHFRRALEVEPDLAPAHSNLGCLLAARLDRFEEGARHIEIAWSLAPEDRDVMCNRAMLLQQRGELGEALALCERLIAENEHADTARLNRALALLKLGDFARGWPEYEARKNAPGYARRPMPGTEWKGEPLAGRTLFVHAEQGIGDQIMFASCVPDAMRRAGRCVIECEPKLLALFRRSFSGATVVSTAQTAAGGAAALPPVDYHVAIGSLPRYFRNAPEDFPKHDGYLRADPEKIAAWRERLARLPGARKIGISWRGGLKTTRQSVRSLPLEAWLPILRIGGLAFVSLQYTDCGEELARLERDHGVRIPHWQEAIEDYDETAALVCALDLVVSVQTSVVHLAGALGRPAWVMVPAVAEWRYLARGERMPWYPSVEIWRQREPGEWAPVVEAIARRLAAAG